MKKIAFFSMTLLIMCMAGCDNKIPMEEDLWSETVYLVGAKDKIIDRSLNIGYEKDTIYTSVAISGSLPTKENVIVIRKGFGRVRILVPYGVGVMIHHHGFAGQLEFENQSYTLSNESIQLYSKEYQRTSKRIKIYTTIVAGKIEVIEA